VLKLLNVLLPEVTENQNDPLVVDKKSFLADRPYLIEKLEMDALPRLIQVGRLSCYYQGFKLWLCHILRRRIMIKCG